ncbi:MAG: PAS domain-containing sensor histidine kinase [Promethearchaeota archaeon]
MRYNREKVREEYKNIFKYSLDLIIVLDLNGNINDANEITLRMLEYKKEEFLKLSLEDLINKNQKKIYLKIIKELKKTGKHSELNTFNLKKKGEDFLHVELIGIPIKNDGLLNGILCIARDITERKKEEAIIKKFNEELEREVQIRTRELNKALEHQKYLINQVVKVSIYKTDFLSTMSHELRTPLNAIIGFSDLLLEKVYGPLTKEQLDFIKDIKTSAEHQLNMIEHIFDISKIEAGQVSLDIKKFSLNSIIDQVRSILQPLYSEKNLVFKVRGLNTDKEIYADPIRFKEILLNLLTNAIKFTIKGKITLIVQEKRDYWLFKVRDTGIGISEKDFNILFKEFKRVNSEHVRSIPGIGLGLALTKMLVILHGGDINFFSVLGKGTTFTFRIPKKKKNFKQKDHKKNFNS